MNSSRFAGLFSVVLLSAVGLPLHGAGSLTARQVIRQIQEHAGKSWSGPTVDTFKAGDPDTPVTGIATSFAATYDVLQRAAAQGKNLIVAHEPTFYNHQDQTEWLKGDLVYQEKLAFIKEHHMVVFRFHDHWHAPQFNPDGILHGMVQALGWQKFQDPSMQNRFVLPESSLADLAAQIKNRLQIHIVRVVGPTNMKVTNIALLPGAGGREMQIKALRRDDVQVLVAGESSEWETVEYVRDAVSEHRRKALILLGHVPSEEEGMRYCAEWLKSILPDMPVEFIPAREPFWTPPLTEAVTH